MRNICDGARALRGRGEALDVLLARPERPSRCTFPITALRVMPPSSAAIWLAERPSDQSFFKSSTRSSVHDIPNPASSPAMIPGPLVESLSAPGSAYAGRDALITDASGTA